MPDGSVKLVDVAVRKATNTVHVLVGDSFEGILRNLNTTRYPLEGDQLTLDVEAGKHVIVQSAAQEAGASFTFTYQLVDPWSHWWFLGGFAAGVMAISACVAVCIFFPLRAQAINQSYGARQRWNERAHHMMLDMKRAQQQHEEYLTSGSLPPGHFGLKSTR